RVVTSLNGGLAGPAITPGAAFTTPTTAPSATGRVVNVSAATTLRGLGTLFIMVLASFTGQTVSCTTFTTSLPLQQLSQSKAGRCNSNHSNTADVVKKIRAKVWGR